MKYITSKFILLTLLFSWAVHIPFALRAQKVIDFSLPMFIIWLPGIIPAIVAFLLVRNDEGRLQSLKTSIGRVKVPAITLLVCVALPLLCLTTAYVANPQLKLFLSPQVAIFGFVWFILAYGEEIGWRGLALPELSARFNPFVAASIVGVFWCIWHYPKGMAYYQIEDWTAALKGLGMFSLQIFLANYILCWLYFKGNRSVFVTSLFHGLFNVTATIYSGMAMNIYVTTVLGVIAFGLILWDRDLFFSRQPLPLLVPMPQSSSDQMKVREAL